MRYILAAILFMACGFLFAQSSDDRGTLTGGFQSDIQFYKNDKVINASAPDEKIASNNYLKVDYTYLNFQMGVRYEAYLPALLGYPVGLDGTGIVNRYASFTNDVLKITAGNFYAQFGSGMVLRTYEERTLGIDNSLDGIKVEHSPLKGLNLTGVYGSQRKFFAQGDGLVRGLDGNVFLNDLFDFNSLPNMELGFSVVSKFEEYTGPNEYHENINAYSFRAGIQMDKIDLKAEYVEKDVDPNVANGYNTIRKGRGLMINAGYSKKGIGINATFRRLENMNFRSERTADQNNLWINYLPSETRQHGYALANIYPYAAQGQGEIGGQINVNYNIKKETALGGKYGTNIAINYSDFRSLKNIVNPALSLETFNTNLFEFGDTTYYRDFNVEVKKKFNKSVLLTANYIHIEYNKNKVEGVPVENVKSEIAVLESFIKIPNSQSLRLELQHLWTQQDKKNWLGFLAEYNVARSWTFFYTNQYNYGGAKKPNYYQSGFAYSKSASRVSMSYGRQRGGLICVGGVCRFVPASSGLTVSITTSF